MTRHTGPSPELAGTGLIILAAVCFGTLGPLTRFADAAEVSPLALVAWRAAIGAIAVLILLTALHRLAGRRPLSPRRTPPRERAFIVAGGLTNLVLNLAMFVAFVRIEIGLALLLFYCYPAVVAAASVLWFGQRLDALRWSALGLSMLGLVLTLTGSGGLGQVDGVGVALALLAAGAQAFYVLAARHGFAGIPPIEVAATTMGIAAVGYLVIATVTGQLASMGAPLASMDALWPVVAAGLVGAAIPTLAFVTGIRMLGAPRAAILATLEPVVGVALAAWLLNERPGLVQLIGGVLVVAAAVMLQRRPEAPPSDHEAVEGSDQHRSDDVLAR